MVTCSVPWQTPAVSNASLHTFLQACQCVTLKPLPTGNSHVPYPSTLWPPQRSTHFVCNKWHAMLPLFSLVSHHFSWLTRRCLYYFTSFIYIYFIAHHNSLSCSQWKDKKTLWRCSVFPLSVFALCLSGNQENNGSWHSPAFSQDAENTSEFQPEMATCLRVIFRALYIICALLTCTRLSYFLRLKQDSHWHSIKVFCRGKLWIKNEWELMELITFKYVFIDSWDMQKTEWYYNCIYRWWNDRKSNQ